MTLVSVSTINLKNHIMEKEISTWERMDATDLEIIKK